MMSAVSPHRFLGISPAGQVSVIHTMGNKSAHVVLRGGATGPNYSAEHVQATERALADAALPESIMVDCSHANSSKDHRKQAEVLRCVTDQKAAGNTSITGVMLESNINPGNQKINGAELEYGVSVTDACIGWEETRKLLLDLNAALMPENAQTRASVQQAP